MSQNDLVLANADGATFRADLNAALQALASMSKGATAPGTTYSGQVWWDTGNNLIRVRNAANSGWVDWAHYDGTTLRSLAGGEEVLTVAPIAVTDGGTDAFSGDFGRDVANTETVRADFGSANTTTTPTLENTGGTPAAQTITTKDGSALWEGALSGVHELQLNAGGTAWLVLDPNPNGGDEPASVTYVEGSPQVAQVWVNFNGAGIVSIRDHYNVSSITDNGTGDYTVNFSTNLADANYSAVGMNNQITTNIDGSTPPSNSSFTVQTRDANGTEVDGDIINIVVFGGES